MSDLDIIKQIEKELNIKFEKLEDINYGRGYTLNQNGQVTGINLSSYAIKNLNRIVSPLKGLRNLKDLSLGDNKLSDISSLKDLKALRRLWLYSNQLTDISPLKDLKNLTLLYFQGNRLSDISPLKDLKNLTDLTLYNNQLSDISPLKDLRKLRFLDLQKNPIEELPSWITDFKIQIRYEAGSSAGYITFHDNPLKIPPPEIVKQGKEAIKNYFEQIKEQEEDYLFEAKMLIVGEPGAGKTSMAWKMENANCKLPKEKETTKGIDVKQYYFPLQKEDFSSFKNPEKLKNRKFRLNLWDFGGQEIYKATHRFFLSKRSLYSLVADSRNEDTDFNYWLNIVEMFGGDSPLLIVLNEKHQPKRNIDIEAMRKRFTNISEVLAVDFADEDKTRLNKLERAVKYYVSQLPLVGSPVPAKWSVVREALEKDKHNTITLQDYLKICNDNGITKPKDALVLSQYFHDIGVFLHFQDDALLKNIIFLKPNWATSAAYKILDHELLNKTNGRFNKTDAETIWSEDEYELVRDQLLRLMQKFFLTYEIENSGEYIVPERLQSAQPKYDWDEKDNLFLRYEYDIFMPKGIMSQFTVQMNRYIINHDQVWMRGVVLEREKTTAEIIETYDARKIKIKISGKNKRDFMTIITENLDQINSQFEKMKVDKMIPCNCSECKTDDQPYFFEYKKLKRRLDNNINQIDCENSFRKVNIRSLIDEVINPEKGSPENGAPLERTKVFVSYSHKDKEWLEKVQTHLKVLNKLGLTVNKWDDTQIKSGMKWRAEIKKALSEAKAAILLVSTDFLASDFISTDELPPLLKAAENEGTTILPLILKPCLFTKHKELAEFQSVNEPSQPLSKLSDNDQDEVLVNLANRIC